ncbi:hypothetical protein GMORB2_4424 [Geosmithia morbida]|uniref:Uncharacterized protein n=1 Tax=Geosmithia morbida TaxID=1094350 RepID=A0A9P4YQA9_9HYPO|nr:uncharacterized protein GMORB2_4424 [Geosmithia morbida]KAF4119758.1 hypothetical protein GMORB2_4424 [Geosmithia morbida]
MGRHSVVLVRTGGMGEARAAVTASGCRESFPMIRPALVVGVCGAVTSHQAYEQIADRYGIEESSDSEIDNADDEQITRGSAGVDDSYQRAPLTARADEFCLQVKPIPKAISADRLDDHQAADRLLELLTYLPLAITQAEHLGLFRNTERGKMELLS